jgi:hypothetical protein
VIIIKSKGLSVRNQELRRKKPDWGLISKNLRGSLTDLPGEGVRGVLGRPISDQRPKTYPTEERARGRALTGGPGQSAARGARAG